MKVKGLISGLMVLFLLPLFSCGGGGGGSTGLIITSPNITLESVVNLFLPSDEDDNVDITFFVSEAIDNALLGNTVNCTVNYTAINGPTIPALPPAVVGSFTVTAGNNTINIKLMTKEAKATLWTAAPAVAPGDPDGVGEGFFMTPGGLPFRYDVTYNCEYRNDIGKGGRFSTPTRRITIDLDPSKMTVTPDTPLDNTLLATGDDSLTYNIDFGLPPFAATPSLNIVDITINNKSFTVNGNGNGTGTITIDVQDFKGTTIPITVKVE